MNKHFKIIILVFVVNLGFSQKKPNVECGYFGKKTVEERNKMFPFSMAKKVLLISFIDAESIMLNEGGLANDSLGFTSRGYKIEKVFNLKKVDSLKRYEKYNATKIVKLTDDKINFLSNLLVNYKIKINKYPFPVSDVKCYTPRNAVLFLDETETVISVLEICFECHKYYLFPDPYETQDTLGVECDQKINYFKELFINNGFEIKEF